MGAKHLLMVFAGTFISVAIIARVAPLRSLAGL